MPEFLHGNHKVHFRMPFTLEGTLTGCFFKAGEIDGESALQRHYVEPFLNAASTPGRFTVALGGYCFFSFNHFDQCHGAPDENWGAQPGETCWGNIPYQEVSLVFAVTDTHATGGEGSPELFWYSPVMVLDSFFQLVAGREIYGYAKIAGTITPARPHADLERQVSVEGFTTPTDDCAMQVLATLTPEGDIQSRPPLALGTLAHEEFLPALKRPKDLGDDVWNFIYWFLEGKAPGVFLKQFPAAEDTALTCYQRIVTNVHRLERLSLPNWRAMRLTLGNPASLPLASMLFPDPRRDPAAPVEVDLAAAFVIRTEQTILAGRELDAFLPAPAPRRPQRPRPSEKRHVAILGGGLGSLITALELTRPEVHKVDYKVTIYQIGWRLGGKGASGRNADVAQRIEEHGLHFLLGFYENTFRLMREVMEEWEIPANHPWAAAHPTQRWRHAFKPHQYVPLADWRGDRWGLWHFRFQAQPGEPGDGKQKELNIWSMLRLLVGLLLEAPEKALQSLGVAQPMEKAAEVTQAAAVMYPMRRLCDEWTCEAETLASTSPLDWLRQLLAWRRSLLLAVRLVRRAARWMESPDEALRRLGLLLNLGWALYRGLAWNALRIHRGTLDVLDDLDLRRFLRRHGATEAAVNSPLVASIYDGVFAFHRGQIGLGHERIAAGAGLRCFFRIMFSYKGAMSWKMQAGMGDTIFTPLYEVLRARGVKFEFFHTVRSIQVASDGKSIESVELDRQVHLRDPKAEYEPVRDCEVKGLRCWPNRPHWPQIDPGDATTIQNLEIDLEDPDSLWPNRGTVTLVAGHRDGSEEDDESGNEFDHFVLGIPVGALRSITSDLAEANPRFADMLQEVKTVRTGCLQLWLKPTLPQLGWTHGPPLLGNYLDPLNTWADMTHLLRVEEHRADLMPGSLHYFCGPMPDSVEPDHLDTKAKELLNELSRSLWPGTQGTGGGFNSALILGEYPRFNRKLSDRYVLTLPGSTERRLRADESGFRNLVLAGDWTRNQFNVGCVEATVMSGLWACRAISGLPRREDITYGKGP